MKIFDAVRNIKYFKKHFGLIGGIKAYMLFSPIAKKMLIKREIVLPLKRYNYKVRIRVNSTDSMVLKDVLMDGQYNKIWEDNFIRNRDMEITVLDAGANIGTFCMICKYFSQNANIIAIEPDDDNYEMLKKNLQSFSNVCAIKAGIWKKVSKLQIKSNELGSWGITVEESNDGAIQGLTIQSIIDKYKLQKTHLLKMDIEGSEMEVFQADDDEWLDLVNILVIEVHEDLRPGVTSVVHEKMKAKGFEYIYNHEDIIFYRGVI